MRWNLLTAALVLLLATVAMTARVEASIITYETSGTGSGSLDGVNFLNEFFSVLVTADTASVQVVPGGGSTQYAVNNLSLVVQLGAATYAGTLPGASYLLFPASTTFPPAYAYTQFHVGDDFDPFNFYVDSFSFTPYDLKTSLGPLSDVTMNMPSAFGVPTTAGIFRLNSTSQLSFHATVAEVPEPSMFLVAMLLTASAAACWQRER
jgi:hypothetical protein